MMGLFDSPKKAGSSQAQPRTHVPIEEFNRLKKWYSDELKRKDAEIDELKRTNTLLMKTALKRSAEQQKMLGDIAEMRKKLSRPGQSAK